ncbi:MAG: hypothetical protein COB85_07820 [Bacteroidetes bacterium]|nr:MAG: hypothetical protein COB85_07820 [Bacteroidota bacterium]
MKAVKDNGLDGNIEIDGSLGFWGIIPIPFVSAFPSLNYLEQELYTHVTSKVVRYPAIPKSVLTYKDGIYHLTENLVFDPETGVPVITQTSDGFDELSLEQSSDHDGSYYSYSIKGAQKYDETGQKAINERVLLESGANDIEIKLIHETDGDWLYFSGDGCADVCDAMSLLYPGDLIKVGDGFYHVGYPDGNYLEVFPSESFGSSSSSVTNATVEVIRSGRTNQLGRDVGSITTYGEKTEFVTTPGEEDPIRRKFVDYLNGKIEDGETLFEVATNRFGFANMMVKYADSGDCYDVKLGHLRSLKNYYYIIVDLTGDKNAGTGYVCVHSDGLSMYSSSDDFPDCVCPDGDGHDVSIADDPCYEVPGYFALDSLTGDIVFYSADNSCSSTLIECLEACDKSYPVTTLENVVTTSSRYLADDWGFDRTIFGVSSSDFDDYNNYELGKIGKWRNLSKYIYRTSISGINASNSGARNYNSGIFEDYQLLNWDYEEGNEETNWLKLSTVNKYSPYGYSMQTVDLRKVYSTVKYGYQNTVSIIIANNAKYSAVQFESFENTYDIGVTEYFEDGLVNTFPGTVVSDNAHSGNQSIKISASGGATKTLELKDVSMTQQLRNNGLSLKLWLKLSGKQQSADISGFMDLDLVGSSGTTSENFEKTAQTGEWTLYECKVTDFSALGSSGFFTPEIKITLLPIFKGFMFIDDIRLQPLNAQANCFVYDPTTLRLVTSFDDQHFGLYYEYNAEGKLVRKNVETENGLKTIEETQYHILKRDR